MFALYCLNKRLDICCEIGNPRGCRLLLRNEGLDVSHEGLDISCERGDLCGCCLLLVHKGADG